MKSFLYSAIAAVLIAPAILTAGKITASDFLKTAKKDFKLVNHQELVDYLESSSATTPYIQKIEFRTETHDFDIREQSYSLRFYPRGIGETHHAARVASFMKKKSDAQHREIYNEALLNRYETVLFYLQVENDIDLHKKRMSVIEDRIAVLRKIAKIQGDTTALIEAEDRYIDLRLDLVKLQNIHINIKAQIEQITGKEVEIAFDESELLPLESVDKKFLKESEKSIADNIYLQVDRIEIELAESRYKLEMAKERDILSFLKLSYDSKDSDYPERAFSIGLGIKLPFINEDREGLDRKKIKYLSEKLKYEEEKRVYSEKVVSLKQSIKLLLQQYAILEERKNNGNAKISFKRHLSMEGADPLTLLKLKESIIKNDIRHNQIRFLILHNYLYLLDASGNLSPEALVVQGKRKGISK